MNRVLAFAVVLMISILVPEIANAQWSKASSKFTYKGVKVEVVDRRNKMGKVHHNTYGYANFTNSDQAVTVNWRCYGVLPGSGKLVLLREETFPLAPNETRGQVYNYDAGKFTYKDFEKYVVSIEVLKDAPAPVTVNAQNADEVYSRLSKKIGNFSQDDFSLAIDWMNFIFNTQLSSIWDSEIVPPGKQGILDRWTQMAEYLDKEYSSGKMNSENRAKFKELQNMIP